MVPNRSKHLVVFGIFSMRYKDWLTHCGETDKLVSSVTIFLHQTTFFIMLTQIPDCDVQSPAL